MFSPASPIPIKPNQRIYHCIDAFIDYDFHFHYSADKNSKGEKMKPSRIVSDLEPLLSVRRSAAPAQSRRIAAYTSDMQPAGKIRANSFIPMKQSIGPWSAFIDIRGACPAAPSLRLAVHYHI
jgi:hypothetical protein